ncbi:hypothetical protein [Sphaerisporangium perillae]|uniref:hypothetical protein n=1 Tax=Sphaerisporangium perillae TaxID=2935860 RepID=UPI00200C2479|nr:hypothetical protein [Sphaerisporangium perillae]
MNRRRAVVVAGVIAVLGLSGSGAVAASAGQEPPAVKCDPATVGSRAADPADEKAKANSKDEPIGTEELAPALAAELGISLDQATSALQELFAHADERGGLQPDSPSFHAVADRLGISTEQLRQALARVKQALDPIKQGQDAIKQAPDAVKQAPDAVKRAAQPPEDSASPGAGKP